MPDCPGVHSQMKRSKFLVSFFALFGAATAQKSNPTPDGLGTPRWKYCAVPGNELSKLGEPPWYCGTTQFKAARPDQCPVCGTMAEPFIRAKGTGTILSGWIGSNAMSVNLTRCKRCNAAFWQDATE